MSPVPATPDDAPLATDLRVAPAAFAKVDRILRVRDVPELEGAWLEHKARLEGPHTAADERDALWLAISMARAHGAARAHEEERAVLEAARERLSIPAYRVMTLTRLARAAAFLDDLALARRWLEDIEPTGYPDVESDVTVARAFVALKAGDAAETLALLRDTPEESSITGMAQPLADLLRIDALERDGRGLRASFQFRKALSAHGGFALQSLILYYGLGKAAQRRAVLLIIVSTMFSLATIAALVWWFFLRR